MDGIAAIEARVAEIVGRFASAPPAPSQDLAAGNGFAAHLRQALAPVGAPPSAGVAASSRVNGDVDRWIADAIERAGVPQSWAPALKTIAQHESSFDPAAANLGASGGNLAKTPLGLMQMLPSTFAGHARPGADILNPVDNLTAAIDYIRDRYGDPSATPGLRALARGEHYRGY